MSNDILTSQHTRIAAKSLGNRADDKHPSHQILGIKNHTFKSLRPYLAAVEAFKNGRDFQVKSFVHRKRRPRAALDRDGYLGNAYTVCLFSCVIEISFPSMNFHF